MIGIDKSTVIIGIIGRLVPIKNHQMFFEAAKRLIDVIRNERLFF